MAENLRVLFVDDEPRVLEGLSRLLRLLRHEWETTFVDSGAAALRHVEQQPVDVVVSDMRMPGMDGIELLERIAVVCPAAARIALTGHTEREHLRRAVGPAHQWLTKPCDLARLRAAVERSARLRALISSPAVQALIPKATALSAPPPVYQRMTTALHREDVTIAQIVDVIEQDAEITTQLLQIAHSAVFDASRSVSTIAELVQLIGFDAIRSLVISTHLFSLCPACPHVDVSREWILRHGVDVAAAAKAIAQSQLQSVDVANACFSAGLLHDCGLYLLLHHAPIKFARAFAVHRSEGVRLIEAERRVFATDHAQVGAYLLDRWGLPDQLIDAAAFHHAPTEAQHVGFSPLMAVHVADALLSNKTAGIVADLDVGWLRTLGLDDRMESWRSAATQGISTD